MNLVMIESPFAAKTDAKRERNREYLRLAIADCIARGEAPFAAHGFFTQHLDDDDPMQRALGLAAGFAWQRKADIVAVYNDYGESQGMRLGIENAELAGIPVYMRTLHGAANE